MPSKLTLRGFVRRMVQRPALSVYMELGVFSDLKVSSVITARFYTARIQRVQKPLFEEYDRLVEIQLAALEKMESEYVGNPEHWPRLKAVELVELRRLSISRTLPSRFASNC